VPHLHAGEGEDVHVPVVSIVVDDGSHAPACAGADLSALLHLLRRKIDEPLLPLPDPVVVRRKLFHVAQPTARRSQRIAALRKGQPSSAVKRAHVILMKKLGISTDEERLSATQLQEYAKIFASPLDPEQVAAIAALFGLDCADEAAVVPAPAS
jgi:hypothetical protein